MYYYYNMESTKKQCSGLTLYPKSQVRNMSHSAGSARQPRACKGLQHPRTLPKSRSERFMTRKKRVRTISNPAQAGLVDLTSEGNEGRTTETMEGVEGR